MTGGSAPPPPRGVLAILGATATGKSALALELAARLGGEIISADAFTAYRGLDVGTAKPTLEERARVPHHLIDVKDPREPFSAGEFARLARSAAEEILGRGRLPILCGGTGFYARTFFHGLFEGPTRSEPLREALAAVAARRGPAFLKRWLSLVDPEASARVLPGDAARATRLLEIHLLTGERPSRLFRERPGERWVRPSVKVLLTLPRPVLYERISERFRLAMSTALPLEVRRLLEAGVPSCCPGFSAIGYRETVDYLGGRLDRAGWEEIVVRSTRRFAKRQETWFRKEPDLVVLRADREDLTEAVSKLADSLYVSVPAQEPDASGSSAPSGGPPGSHPLTFLPERGRG